MEPHPILEYIGIAGDGLSRVRKIDGNWSLSKLDQEVKDLMKPKRTFNATTQRWSTQEKPSPVKVFFIRCSIPKAEILPLSVLLQRAEKWWEMKVSDEILYGKKLVEPTFSSMEKKDGHSNT